jgi:hypothetical protein
LVEQRLVVVCPAGVVTTFEVLDASERVGAAENLEATVGVTRRIQRKRHVRATVA